MPSKISFKFKKPSKHFFKNAFSKLDFRDKTNEELIKIIKVSFIGSTATVVFVIAAFVFFGPYIGKAFGLLSKYRYAKVEQKASAPTPPIFSNAPNAVKEPKVTLQGFSAAGNTLKLFVNGPEKGTATADADGKFTFLNVELINGRNTLYAKAINNQNLESEKSETLIVNVDKTKPQITLYGLKDKDVVKNLNDRVIIKGAISEKGKIVINERSVIVKPDLTFEHILGVKQGEVEIKITATDEAGNEEKMELKVQYKKES